MCISYTSGLLTQSSCESVMLEPGFTDGYVTILAFPSLVIEVKSEEFWSCAVFRKKPKWTLEKKDTTFLEQSNLKRNSVKLYKY